MTAMAAKEGDANGLLLTLRPSRLIFPVIPGAAEQREAATRNPGFRSPGGVITQDGNFHWIPDKG